MAWIRVIGPAEAQGELAEQYARLRERDGSVDNILTIHSLNHELSPTNVRSHQRSQPLAGSHGSPS